ncbi:MAG: hypothetical protein LBO82_00590 [Synergistaceae bacterium]|jgi:Cu2+-exporting ATPase|nr:hypothetical protein [Synergistaceae bacterium]
MEFSIAHELPGRLRLRCPKGAFTEAEGRVIGALLETQPGVVRVAASHRTGGLLIDYDGDRALILTAVKLLDSTFYGDIDGVALPGGRPGLGDFLRALLGGVIGWTLLPVPLRCTVTVVRALPLLGRGLRSLRHEGCLSVPVLGASAAGVSILRRNFRTASLITALLAGGDLPKTDE